MRIFSSVFAIILFVVALFFALLNRQQVSVEIWPYMYPFEVPLYAVALVPLAIGFLAGSLWGMIGAVSHRLHLRRLNKEMVSLNGKIGELQKAAVVQQAKAKPKLSFWSRT